MQLEVITKTGARKINLQHNSNLIEVDFTNQP